MNGIESGYKPETEDKNSEISDKAPEQNENNKTNSNIKKAIVGAAAFGTLMSPVATDVHANEQSNINLDLQSPNPIKSEVKGQTSQNTTFEQFILAQKEKKHFQEESEFKVKIGKEWQQYKVIFTFTPDDKKYKNDYIVIQSVLSELKNGARYPYKYFLFDTKKNKMVDEYEFDNKSWEVKPQINWKFVNDNLVNAQLIYKPVENTGVKENKVIILKANIEKESIYQKI